MNIKEHFLRFFPTCLNSESNLDSMNNSIWSSFSSAFEGNNNLMCIVPRMLHCGKMFWAGNTGPGERATLCPEQTPLLLNESSLQKILKLDSFVFHLCVNNGAALTACLLRNSHRKCARCDMDNDCLELTKWPLVKCFPKSPWIWNQVLKGMRPYVLMPVSFYKY